MLSSKSALVTGGSTGIGLACAEALLEAGANVTMCARTESALESETRRLSRTFAPEKIGWVVADVSEQGSCERAVASVIERYGKLDATIHAAAVLQGIGSVLEVDPAEWLATVRVNLFGTFNVVRASCAQMQKSGGGRIVLFSGGGASAPFPNYTAYACSKLAVVRFAETVAVEMEPYRIEINCIAPGFVATRMHENTLAAAERAGTAYVERTKAELEGGGVPASLAARAAVFLASDAARGITGKLASAVHDDWQHWPEHLAELRDGDLFTLRRVLPKDRGLDWQ